MALKCLVEAVGILRASDHFAVADALEEAVIALADDLDQQRNRAEMAEEQVDELTKRLRREIENNARDCAGDQ